MSDDPRYVAGSGPVNLRTARKALPPPPVPRPVRDRIDAARARGRLGRPLAELARPADSAVGRNPVRKRAVAGAMLAAGGGVGLFLAWIQATPLLGMAAAAGTGAGLWLLHLARPPADLAAAPQQALFDEESLRRLDKALDQVAPALTDDLAAQLQGIKAVLAALARHGGVPDADFTVDDRLWVGECVRRYLPDSLEAWLRVPAQHRGIQVLDSGQTADASLQQQLALLHEGLAAREARAARSAGEALLRQQRFLAAKSRSG